MKKSHVIIWLVLLVFIVGGLGWMYFLSPDLRPHTPSKYSPEASRQIVQYSLAADHTTDLPPTIPANKLPTFTVDISDPKYKDILNSSPDDIQKKVQAKIMYAEGTTKADKIDFDMGVNAEKQALIVNPKDLPNFKPGKYTLSLTLRTLEGDVNINQDFTWGVIAVNTNKSIYQPGDVATIGIGVLNDKGETQCVSGPATATVWLTITDPKGAVTDYSTEARTIKDSGECGPNTVTNDPDFISIYLVNGPGIYT